MLCVLSGISAPQVVLCMFHWLPYTYYRVAYTYQMSGIAEESVFTPFTAARDRERRTRYTTARGLSAGRVEPNRFAWFLLEEVRAQVWRATIPVT